jgi:hypothetical protein
LLVYCFSVYALYGGKSSTKLALVGISFVIKKKVPFLPRCIGCNALDSEIFSGNIFIDITYIIISIGHNNVNANIILSWHNI